MSDNRFQWTIIINLRVFYCFIAEPPKILQAPDALDAREKDDVNITCLFKGKPQPKITWCTDEKVISPNKRYQINSTSESTTLTIKGVETTDSASYILNLENPVGKTSHTTVLNVSSK
jgi:hypothetical protein